MALAEQLQIPVSPTLMGKGAIPEDHPLYAGVVGIQTQQRFANAIFLESDLVLAIGARFADRHTGARTGAKASAGSSPPSPRRSPLMAAAPAPCFWRKGGQTWEPAFSLAFVATRVPRECRDQPEAVVLRSEQPLLRLPQGDSDGARPPSDRQLKRALIVPMHGTQRVRPSGASVGRRQASTSSAPP